jgi:hypothetical protein
MSAHPARSALAIRPGLLPAALGTRVARLRLVAPVRARTRRTPFVIIVVAVLSLGLVGLIVLSTALQDQAFELADLRQQAAALKLQQEKAQHEVDYLESPASVARKAIGLSMVPNRNPVFLRLSDGSVVGSPAPAAPRTNVKRVDQ